MWIGNVGSGGPWFADVGFGLVRFGPKGRFGLTRYGVQRSGLVRYGKLRLGKVEAHDQQSCAFLLRSS